LGQSAQGYAAVTPGRKFSFPTDHGPHPEYRIEWWYVTANLADKDGTAYGAQWTLFRQAMTPGGAQEGWASQQIWMAHAAVTRADTHRTSETFARGGLAKPASRRRRFAPGSIHGRCAAPSAPIPTPSRRSTSPPQPRISPTRCISTPIAHWCARR